MNAKRKVAIISPIPGPSMYRVHVERENYKRMYDLSLRELSVDIILLKRRLLFTM